MKTRWDSFSVTGADRAALLGSVLKNDPLANFMHDKYAVHSSTSVKAKMRSVAKKMMCSAGRHRET